MEGEGYDGSLWSLNRSNRWLQVGWPPPAPTDLPTLCWLTSPASAPTHCWLTSPASAQSAGSAIGSEEDTCRRHQFLISESSRHRCMGVGGFPDVNFCGTAAMLARTKIEICFAGFPTLRVGFTVSELHAMRASVANAKFGAGVTIPIHLY